MTEDLVILSPEKTILTFRLAGLGPRMFAHLLDGLILFGIIMGGSIIVSRFPFLELPFMIILFMIPFLYMILFEGLWNGQTLGKKAMRIRVRMADGTPCTLASAFLRNIVRVGDFLPSFYFAGIVLMCVNRRFQRMGDMVAGTIVVHEQPPLTYNAGDVPYAQEGVHRFEEFVGPLGRMTPVEYTALRRMCDRIPYLPVPVQERLLREVWLPIARANGVPEIHGVHPIHLAEAAVMKYGREHGLL